MIELTGVSKSFSHGGQLYPVLFDLTLSIAHHEFVAIVGRSGSGKSTTMNILGLLDTPTEGRYTLNQQEVGHLSLAEKAKIRNETIGFVFQQFMLLPRMTVLENVALPLLYRGWSVQAAQDQARTMLKYVDMCDFVLAYPSTLSGGQQQRVAIARALVGEPALILADEPTGALDSAHGMQVMQVLQSLNASHGVTVVMITHDLQLAQLAKRQIGMADGRLVEVS